LPTAWHGAAGRRSGGGGSLAGCAAAAVRICFISACQGRAAGLRTGAGQLFIPIDLQAKRNAPMPLPVRFTRAGDCWMNNGFGVGTGRSLVLLVAFEDRLSG
jgi:hypothetical protein